MEADDRALLGAARRLANNCAGAVTAVSFGDLVDAGDVGADRVVTLPSNQENADVRAALLCCLAEDSSSPALLFRETAAGGDLARRVAATLGVRPAIGVVAIEDDKIIRRADGGRADLTMPLSRILTIDTAAFDANDGPPREARLLPSPATVTGSRLRYLDVLPPDRDTGPLAEAHLIIGAGGGVTDFDAFDDAAKALCAVKGASRVICDRGLMPRDRQVGASGTLVEPRCYLAFGISGAAQHLQGIQRCQRVVAVNTDLHADMVKRADLAIIADAQEVMPALARLAAEMKSHDGE